jgi:hypothetical protein
VTVRAGVLALVIAIAVGVVLWLRRPDPAPAARLTGPVATEQKRAPNDPPASSASDPAMPRPPVARVRKTSPGARRQLAEQIAAARARARASSTSSAQSAAGSDDTIQLEQVSSDVKAAFEGAIPILAECYQDSAGKTAAVQMVIWSDPSIGSVIDTDEMKDEQGKPLAKEVDDCLRSTFDSLELPPLKSGGRLPLQYSFKFD